MALSTYSDLQSAVAGWLNRDDLTDRIPDFINLAESHMNRELKLRTMEKEVPLTLLNGDLSVALPDDFVEPVGVRVDEAWGQRSLRFVSVEDMPVDTSAGDQYMWSISGSDLTFARPTSGDLPLLFRYRFKFMLSDDADTNWLLSTYPDAYLFSTLTEAGPYLRDNDLLSVWTARRDRVLDDINRQEGRNYSRATVDTSLPTSLPSDRRLFGNGGYGYYG